MNDEIDNDNSLKNLESLEDNLFLEGHLEIKSHYIVPRTQKVVVVPIGPSLPHRDQEENYAKYCRIMLILFKPWRDATDLRKKNETWAAAFDEFKVNCSTEIKILMDNMQLLHECRENGHDHLKGLKDIDRSHYNINTHQTRITMMTLNFKIMKQSWNTLSQFRLAIHKIWLEVGAMFLIVYSQQKQVECMISLSLLYLSHLFLKQILHSF